MPNVDQFLSQLQAEAGLADRQETETLAASVLTSLRDRLTPEEAADLEAQLSPDMRALWQGSPVQALFHKATGPVRMSYQEFVEKVASETGVAPERAEALMKVVFRLLKSSISPGEAEDVASVLPKKLKIAWLEA